MFIFGSSSLKVQRRYISLNQAADAFPGCYFFASSLQVQRLLIEKFESSCLRISRMLIFLLVINESSIWQRRYYYNISTFPGCLFLARHHWKFKGDIFQAAYTFPGCSFLRLHWMSKGYSLNQWIIVNLIHWINLPTHFQDVNFFKLVTESSIWQFVKGDI